MRATTIGAVTTTEAMEMAMKTQATINFNTVLASMFRGEPLGRSSQLPDGKNQCARVRVQRMILLVLMQVVLFSGPTISYSQGPAGQGANQAGGQTPEPLIIGAGDLIEVAVFDTPELSGKFRVSENGEASFPLIGILHVSELSTTEVEREIRKRLITGKFVLDPQVSVLIDEYSTQGITVLGEVQKPGVIPPMGGRSLYDVISLAGGLSPLAGMTATVSHRGSSNGTDVAIRDERGKL